MKLTFTFSTLFWDAAVYTLSESMRTLSFRISHNTEDKINLESRVFTKLTDSFQGVEVNLSFRIKDSLAPKEIKALMEELIYLEMNLQNDIKASDKKAKQLHNKYFKNEDRIA